MTFLAMRGFIQNNPMQIDSVESGKVCILRFNLNAIRCLETLEILEIRHILSRIDETEDARRLFMFLPCIITSLHLFTLI